MAKAAKAEKVSKLKEKLGDLQFESMNLATKLQPIQDRLRSIREEMVAVAQDIIKTESQKD